MLIVGVDKATAFNGNGGLPLLVGDQGFTEVAGIGQAGALSLVASSRMLFCGTWGGTVLRLSWNLHDAHNQPWQQYLVGSSGGEPIVQVVHNNGEIFAGTENAVGPKLLHFSASQIGSAANFGRGAEVPKQAPEPAHVRQLPVTAGSLATPGRHEKSVEMFIPPL